MKFLKKFNTIEEYNTYLDSSEFVTPNVSLLPSEVKYNPIDLPLYIEALEDLTISDTTTYSNVYYSRDLINWDVFTDSSGNTPVEVSAGEKVYFQTEGSRYSPGSVACMFAISGACNVGGNAMSMRYGLNYKGKRSFSDSKGFQSMFYGCTTLENAKDLILPATTLYQSSYNKMFSGCTNLKTAPKRLPATKLTSNTSSYYGCYEGMFKDCKSLTIAPEMNVLEVSPVCCASMFSGCENLNNITKIRLSATILKDMCYASMFNGCTSLTTAPELPATTLVSRCYENMFQGCSNLKYIKAMFTTTPSTTYTSNWVSGVSATGTFVKNAAATWNVTGVNGVPSGWTVETATE